MNKLIILLTLVLFVSCSRNFESGRFTVYGYPELNAYCMIWDNDKANGDRIWVSNSWQLLTIEKYKNGKKNGHQYSFYNDGFIRSYCEYKNDTPVGRHVYYANNSFHYAIQAIEYDNKGHVTLSEFLDSAGNVMKIYNPFNKFL